MENDGPRRLEAVQVEDFQALRRVTLPLGRVTAITGDSDRGKSATIRALHAAITASDAKGMARTGSRTWRVTQVVNGIAVSWNGKKYTVRPPGEEARDASRAEVEDITGLREIQVAKDVFFIPNVNPPLAGPSFLLDHPPTAARKLSTLRGGASAALAAMREAKRQVKALDRDRATIQDRRDALAVELDAYWEAGEYLRRAQELRKEAAGVQESVKTFKSLQRTVQRLQRARSTVTRLRGRSEALKGLDVGQETMVAIRASLDELERLKRAWESVVQRKEQLAKTKKTLEARKATEVKATSALRGALKEGTACPFSGETLPESCAKELTKT